MRAPQSVKIDRSDAHKLSLIGHANPRENMLNNGPSALNALKTRSNPTLLRTRTFVAGRWHGSGGAAQRGDACTDPFWLLKQSAPPKASINLETCVSAVAA